MNKYDGFAVDITDQVIRCAIEVHRHLGPGLLESVYESAICIELESAGLTFARQVGVPLLYKGELIAEHRPDLIVGDQVVVEIKSIERFNPVFVAQMLTYLRVTGLRRLDPEFQPRSDERRNSPSESLAKKYALCLCASVARHRENH